MTREGPQGHARSLRTEGAGRKAVGVWGRGSRVNGGRSAAETTFLVAARAYGRSMLKALVIFAALVALYLFMQTEAYEAALEWFTDTLSDLITDQQPERDGKRRK